MAGQRSAEWCCINLYGFAWRARFSLSSLSLSLSLSVVCVCVSRHAFDTLWSAVHHANSQFLTSAHDKYRWLNLSFPHNQYMPHSIVVGTNAGYTPLPISPVHLHPQTGCCCCCVAVMMRVTMTTALCTVAYIWRAKHLLTGGAHWHRRRTRIDNCRFIQGALSPAPPLSLKNTNPRFVVKRNSTKTETFTSCLSPFLLAQHSEATSLYRNRLK